MPTWKRFAILIVSAAGLFFAWDWLTVSDEEAIDAALDRTLARLVARDAAGALEIVDEAFSQEGLAKADLYAGVSRILQSDPARSLETVQRQIRVDGGVAEVKTRIRYFPAQGARMPYPFDSDWILRFQRRGKRDWRIAQVDVADLAGQSRPALLRIIKEGQ